MKNQAPFLKSKAIIFIVLFSVFLFDLNAKVITPTNLGSECSNCAPLGWIRSNRSPDVSNTTNWGGDPSYPWYGGPITAPPNGHTIFPSGVRFEEIKTTVLGLTVGTDYTVEFYAGQFRSQSGGPPTDIKLDGADAESINEKRPVGSVFSTLTSIDSDTASGFTYTLVAGAGDTNNALFTIVGDQLVTNAVFDFETNDTYSIRIQTNDNDGGGTYEEAFTITIIDLCEENTAFDKVWDLNTPGDYTVSNATEAEVTEGIGRLKQDSGSYFTTKPYVTPTTAQLFFTTVDSFEATLAVDNEGTVSFQVSTDGGTTWKYWDGAAWATTTATDGTQTNTAADINTNIMTLDTDGGDFTWRAYLESDGTQAVELDQVCITSAPGPCDPVASGNPDTDGDGISDVCDLDDDNDGILDSLEGLGVTCTYILTPIDFSQITNDASFLTYSYTFPDSSVTVTAAITIDGPRDIMLGNRTGYLRFGALNNQLGPDYTFGHEITFYFSSPVSVQIQPQISRNFGGPTNMGTFDDRTSGGDEFLLTATGGFNLNDASSQLSIQSQNSNGIEIRPNYNFGYVQGTWSINSNQPVTTLVIQGGTNIAAPLRIFVQVPTNCTDGRDKDGDGIVDHLDLDSDNDGISDLVESGTDGATYDPDGNGVIDGAQFVSTDLDGLSDDLETAHGPNTGFTPVNSDTDPIPDYLDLDSDGDGIPDTIEARPSAGYVINDGDVNNNDADGDGIIDLFDTNDGTTADFGGTFAALEDTNLDTTPDYLDDDSDGDNRLDSVESGLTLSGNDANDDGIDDHASIGASYADPDGAINAPLGSTTGLKNADNVPSDVDFRSIYILPPMRHGKHFMNGMEKRMYFGKSNGSN